MSEVTIRGITKAYGNVQVLHGIDLDIAAGEFVVFVGPSGCGKSTLLRMIAGLEAISGGTIAIGGTVVNNVVPAKRGIAMVFQNYALYPHMTVAENMGFGLKLARIPAAIALARRTRRIVRQNLAWALAYNLLALPLAMAGLVTPWLAALGMTLSSLGVTLNALRLARAAAPALRDATVAAREVRA